jgi:hypothetical protein
MGGKYIWLAMKNTVKLLRLPVIFQEPRPAARKNHFRQGTRKE